MEVRFYRGTGRYETSSETPMKANLAGVKKRFVFGEISRTILPLKTPRMILPLKK